MVQSVAATTICQNPIDVILLKETEQTKDVMITSIVARSAGLYKRLYIYD